ncbi:MULTISPECIES: DMT family transporter [unclassified Brevibacterium]|uniref:DMT family transporter n=1 Tax=unclassified Brevibacterium TaxID=2614124 RepID=UPI0010F50907|nr:MULTISPECIES: DMT family transporter [unclassified Brevibacterium]MCM1013868.1 DMT family transporter [Brevibacterium sp. XM4083]
MNDNGAPSAQADTESARGTGWAVAAVLSGAVCLSVSAVVVKLAGIDAATTAVLRCAIAIVPLIPLALWEGRRKTRLTARGIAWSIAAGVALGIDYSAWTASIFLVGAGVSTVLINIQVIVLPLLAFLIDRERPRRRFLVAVPLMLVGVGLVSGLGGSGGETIGGPGPGGIRIDGVLLGLLAGLGYGTYLFLNRRATGTGARLALQPLTWATGAAALTSAGIAQFSGGLQFSGISPRSWGLLIVLALVGQVAAWLFIHHGSARLSASVTASLLLLQPVLALAAAAIVLGERYGRDQLLGAALVVGAVAVVTGAVPRRRPRRRPHRP